jgi:small subunit ribosomal protein S20
VPNLPSAAKRVKQNERNRDRNRARKGELKTETRRLLDAIHDGKVDQAKTMLTKISKKLDQIAAKGTLHRNTAARRKSRLAKRVNAAAAAKGK